MREKETEEDKTARKLSKELTNKNDKTYCQNLREVRIAMKLKLNNRKEK